jgi:hypothetical protein
MIGLEDQRFKGITDNSLGKVYTSLHASDGGETGSANRDYDQQMERERLHAYDAGKLTYNRWLPILVERPPGAKRKNIQTG